MQRFLVSSLGSWCRILIMSCKVKKLEDFAYFVHEGSKMDQICVGNKLKVGD